MEAEKIINVAKQFSRFPGGRFYEDGEFSGQRFREKMLVPALNKYQRVVVDLDGTLGYGSSFLEEAFGGLVRISGFTPDQLNKALDVRTQNEVLSYTVRHYIDEARPQKQVTEEEPRAEAVA